MKVLENSAHSAKEAAAILAERTGATAQAIGSKSCCGRRSKRKANMPISLKIKDRAEPCVDRRKILSGGTFDPAPQRAI